MSLALIALIALAALLFAQGLRVRRYSGTHVVVTLTVAGRGLFYTRVPDGPWWRVRLRRRRCGGPCGWPEDEDGPPDIGVREPRGPTGPGPALSERLELPEA